MSKNFEALAIARQNCELAWRRFDGCLAKLSGILLGIGLVAMLVGQVSREVWDGVGEALEVYSQAFVEHGLGLMFAIGVVLMVVLYRDYLLVKTLRKYHEDTPDAQEVATERWLLRRNKLVQWAVWLFALPLVVAAVVLKGAGSLILLVPTVILTGKMLGLVYAPLRSPDAMRGSKEARIRQARNAGYLHARFTDYDVPSQFEVNFEEGTIRAAYKEGLQQGKAMRSRLRRKGIDVDYKGY